MKETEHFLVKKFQFNMQLLPLLLNCFISVTTANKLTICKKIKPEQFDENNSKTSCTESVFVFKELENVETNPTQVINEMKEQLQELKNRSFEFEKFEKNLRDLGNQLKDYMACYKKPCVNGECSHIDNTYQCSCDEGFNGRNCEIDINECSSNTDNCSSNALCTNTVGSFTCSCKTGYSGDGKVCSDIDECSSNTDNCSINALCTNTVGSFTCSCKAGYAGDGKVCSECRQQLGMENRNIPNSRITGSSYWNGRTKPHFGRLNNKKTSLSIGAWHPADEQITSNEGKFKPVGKVWIQVQLVPQQYVTGIITQGRPVNYIQYVTSYNITYSDDRTNFKSIPKTFQGNSDTHTPVTNYFPQAILTSYIRLYPITWEYFPTLRMELLGCDKE